MYVIPISVSFKFWAVTIVVDDSFFSLGAKTEKGKRRAKELYFIVSSFSFVVVSFNIMNETSTNADKTLEWSVLVY